MKKNILFSFSIFLLLFFGCKKTSDQFEGPDLNDLYGSFQVMETFKCSADSVNFSIGQQAYFTAQTSKMVDWEIHIKGLSSGAEKIITGKSKSIDISNSLWNGSTTTLPMFRAEWCAIKLIFPTEQDTLYDSVKVIAPKINSGYLITDFESGPNSGWTSFIQSGANMSFQISGTTPVPQGTKYYNMAGTVNWDWLIGLIEFPSTANGNAHFPLGTNPNNEYFNVMVWGEPGITNALVLFQFREDENNNGTFESASEDEYDYELPVNWTGWKLISVKYSDLVTLVNGAPAMPKGNKIHNPDKLMKVSVLHLANPSTGFSKTKMDYLIFTQNGPLQP
ncbi:MAG: hypothetical protein ACK5D5_00625 [Bacteroidota bacterium]|jgi:hypothetical protein